MNRWWRLAALIVLALAAGRAAKAGDDGDYRNPFKVEDVPDPDGADVQDFADRVDLAGGRGDPNAAQWVKEASAGKKGSLDGEWHSRWNGGDAGEKWISGTARVKSVGGRVYILYSDRTGTYLIDARRVGKDRLVGRCATTGVADDTSPWVGVVVDNERIDGEWNKGRWDLRRSLTPEAVATTAHEDDLGAPVRAASPVKAVPRSPIRLPDDEDQKNVEEIKAR